MAVNKPHGDNAREGAVRGIISIDTDPEYIIKPNLNEIKMEVDVNSK